MVASTQAGDSQAPAILLVRASVRAAAWSALRAGLRPIALDAFGDLDLRAIARVEVIPHGFPYQEIRELAARLPAAPVLLTGPLENHSDLVQDLANGRRSWGTPAERIAVVRDPSRLAEVLRVRGLPHLEVRPSSMGLPADGTWVQKPRASGGGRNVAPWRGEPTEPAGAFYYQRRATGASRSAVFLADGHAAELVGLTRQFHGTPGHLWGYRGSLGPLPIPPRLERRLRDLGEVLASEFGLLGLFGVDLIQAGDRPLPVEVNPRYTASVEVLELATGRTLLGRLRAVFDPSAPPPPDRPGLSRCVGKRILYAKKLLRVPDTHTWHLGPSLLDPWCVPRVADLPAPGQIIRPGEPVLTVLASAPDLRTCLRRVFAAEKQWLHRIETWKMEPSRTDRLAWS